MFKKNIVRVWQTLRDINRNLRKEKVAQNMNILGAFKEYATSIVAQHLVLNSETSAYPEIGKEHYLIPAEYTAFLQGCNTVDGLMLQAIQRIQKKCPEVEPMSIVEIFSLYAPEYYMDLYLRTHPETKKYAVKQSTWEKAMALGDPAELEISLFMDTFTKPKLFVLENGEVYFLYRTPYYHKKNGHSSIIRLELFRPLSERGGTFLDVHSPRGDVTTLGQLLDYYKEKGTELIGTKGCREDVEGLPKVLLLLLLTESSNIKEPSPVEFNETRARLLREGKKSQGNKHQSFKFIDVDELKVASSQNVKRVQIAPNPGTSRRTHMRSGHFRRQPFGPRKDKAYKVIWIATMVVGHGDVKEDRVFYLI